MHDSSNKVGIISQKINDQTSQQFDALKAELTQLEEAVSKLIVRLEVATRREPSSSCNEKVAEEQVLVPIASEIREQTRRVGMVNLRISDQIRLLEI